MGKKKGRKNKGKKGSKISLTALIGDVPVNEETAFLPKMAKEYKEGDLDQYGREVRRRRGYDDDEDGGSRRENTFGSRGDGDNDWRRGGPPPTTTSSSSSSTWGRRGGGDDDADRRWGGGSDLRDDVDVRRAPRLKLAPRSKPIPERPVVTVGAALGRRQPKASKSNPFGAATPVATGSKRVETTDAEEDQKRSGPRAATTKKTPKSNPFGDAKPVETRETTTTTPPAENEEKTSPSTDAAKDSSPSPTTRGNRRWIDDDDDESQSRHRRRRRWNADEERRPAPRNSRWTGEESSRRRASPSDRSDETPSSEPPKPRNSRWTGEESSRRANDETSPSSSEPPKPRNSRWIGEESSRRVNDETPSSSSEPPKPRNSRWSTAEDSSPRASTRSDETSSSPPAPRNSRWSTAEEPASSSSSPPPVRVKTEKELELDRKIAAIRARNQSAVVKTDVFGRPIDASNEKDEKKRSEATRRTTAPPAAAAAEPEKTTTTTPPRTYRGDAVEIPSTYPSDAPDRKTLDRKTRALLDEFFSIRDANEALLCMEELGCPAHYPAVVRELLRVVVESFKDGVAAAALDLLEHARDRLLPAATLGTELDRVASALDDVRVDYPKAPKLFAEVAGPLLDRGAVRVVDVSPATLRAAGRADDPVALLTATLHTALRGVGGDAAKLLTASDDDTVRFVPFDDEALAERIGLGESAPGKVQREAVDALQAFAHFVEFRPTGLCEALYVSAYDTELIEGEAFEQWADDKGSTKEGRIQARRETLSWITWLKEADSDDDDDSE